jgi:hypothetical protein
MKYFTLLIVTILLMNSSYAGSDGTAIIKGRSGTGRTLLELHTSDIGHGVKYLKFTIDGKSYEYDLRKDSSTYGYVVHDHKNKVFTVIIDNKKIIFKFWMIPSKQKIKEQKGTSEKWEFYAYVEATDPREFSDETRNRPISPRIYLYCTLDYSL